ncbi:FxSxx-COOH system tetratricopeptide repeat protein [Actinoplanes sp. HUAS TT8]|uniref:FxSxx-COOH system tetratricopeptide repeat protein n=1 Tax=Actinoplanes sp. HUAS TT8 TaxID=3447453 RepID=UPI003F51AE38
MVEREGQIVTFYSYKGGTGRTMALANVAWILAANGHRVLVADWDLESPGLHRFFAPFLTAEQQVTTGGVIGMITDYQWATLPVDEGGNGGPADQRPADWHREYARVERHAFSINWTFPGGGSLDLLPAGHSSLEYAASVASLNWEDFYDRLGGSQFFDAMREDMKNRYDYTLLDSRTGLSDVADICTIHLPDVIVDCFTLSEQGIDGAANVAQHIRSYDDERTRRTRRILPVPMRVDLGEKFKADAGRTLARRRFPRLPAGMTEDERRDYWNLVEVPYRTYYAYEETLATFGDEPGNPASLLGSYERLAGYITDGRVTRMPPIDPVLRRQVEARFERRPALLEETLVLRYAPEDQAWAEWALAVYSAARLRVHDGGRPGDVPAEPGAREVVLWSDNFRGTGNRSAVALCIGDDNPGHDDVEAWEPLRGAGAEAAIGRTLRLVGADDSAGAGWHATLPRFPGEPAQVQNAPVKNPRFTGRHQQLRELRETLKRSGGTPVALIGGAGMGKSQLAIEYAHRFSGAYDVIWWVPADPPQFVETIMSDLGAELNFPRRATLDDTAGLVVRRLSRGGGREGTPLRWLLIFDNADRYADVERYLPRGNGHLLITTRNAEWGDVARVLEVEGFSRAESIEHLRYRLGGRTLTRGDADRIADAVSDLPILVVLAAAWLHDTGRSGEEYLAGLDNIGTVRSTATAVWEVILERLRGTSHGAYRLLQLMSMLQPDISLGLLYSDEVARVIARYDDDVAQQLADRMSEHDVTAALMQPINRLSLVKLDPEMKRVTVHRLLQSALRDRMTPERRAEVRHAVHLVLAGARPAGEVEDPATWEGFRLLWGHLDGSDPEGCGDDDVRQLVIDRIRYIYLAGSFRQGLEYAIRADERWTARLEELPDDDPDRHPLLVRLLHLRFHRGNLLRSLGEFVQARDLDERTLIAQEELIGESHPYTLFTAGSYGGDLRALGDYHEALERDLRTHRASATRFGEDHRRTLSFANNLGTSYRLTGDFRRALELDRATYNRMAQVLGEDHHRTLLTGNNLGSDLREAGEYQESVERLRKIRRGYEKLYGQHSTDALGVQVNLAVSLRGAGHVDEARDLLDEAYDRLRINLGEDTWPTLLTRLSRAATMLVTEDYASAREEFEKTEDLLVRRFSGDHPYVLLCRHNLVVALAGAGATETALVQATVSESALRDALGSAHPSTMAAVNNLALLLIDTGDGDTGRAMLADLVARLAVGLGEEHPDTYVSLGNLAVAEQSDHVPVTTRLADRVGSDHPVVRSLHRRRRVYRVLDPHTY